jgi:hypothetical protein
VYYGGDPMDTAYDVGLRGEGGQQHLGWGDVGFGSNTGGHDFLVAGTEFWPRGFPWYSPGKLYVLWGGDPMDSIPDVSVHGQRDSTSLGGASACGDVDGDGLDDIFTGATVEDSFRGAVYVWLTDGGMDTIPDAWMRGEGLFSQPGWRVASAGDVDGDGRDEIVFSNYALQEFWHTVWVCKYTGTGINEGNLRTLSRGENWGIICQPNPFSKSTVIKLIVDNNGRDSGQRDVTVAVHDVTGRIVRRLFLSAPAFRATWDGCDEQQDRVPSGTYFLKPEGMQSTPYRLVQLK